MLKQIAKAVKVVVTVPATARLVRKDTFMTKASTARSWFMRKGTRTKMKTLLFRGCMLMSLATDTMDSELASGLKR